MTVIAQTITGLLKKYPDASTKTIARIAFRDNPSLFRSLEAARSAVRYQRGARGSKDAKKLTDTSFVRTAAPPGNPFALLPKPLAHFDRWHPVQVDGPLRALVINDLHIPYHDATAVKLALRTGLERSCNMVMLNGDIGDFFSVSSWQKDPRKRDLSGELQAMEQFITATRAAFRRARIIYKLGNHEERWESYLYVKAPELCGVNDFKIENVLHLPNYGVECVGEKRPIRLGRLNVIHGHEYGKLSASVVNPAAYYYRRANDHVLAGHLHRASQHSEKDISGHVVSAWTAGCLCEMHPDYAPLNKWCHGFSVVEVDKAGRFVVQNFKVLDGKVFAS